MDRNIFNQGEGTCLLCGSKVPYGIIPYQRLFFHYFDCPICGLYSLEWQQMDFVRQNPAIKTYLRWKTYMDKGKMDDGYRIIEEDVRIENLSELPHNPIEGIDKLLIWIAENTPSQDARMKINLSSDYPQFLAKSGEELEFWINTGKDIDFFDLQFDFEREIYYPRLKIEGWKRYEEIKRSNTKLSKSVFVAKWFDPSLDELYVKGILPAISESKFKAIYMNDDKKTGLIDNKIIAGIKESRFMVADYTGQRPSVYYEAGFASGIGIPVIDCCNKEDFKNMQFDKQHHAMLLWETPEELKEKLIDAIKANIL